MKSIDNEELYDLRKSGKTYHEISDYYAQQGTNITASAILKRCKKIFNKKNELEPRIKTKYKKRISKKIVDEEKIQELRRKGFTYKEIQGYLQKNGINVSLSFIRSRCKEIKVQVPKIPEDDAEKMYELRKKGFTYIEIQAYFSEKEGKTIRYPTIWSTCKEIFEKKGEEQPKLSPKKENIDDDVIYMLREEGKTYEQIVEYFREKGINTSKQTISNRCKKIYSQKAEKEPMCKTGRKKDSEKAENKSVKSLDEKMVEYTTFLVKKQAKGLAPEEIKQVILSDQRFVRAMEINPEIKTILETFRKAPTSQDVLQQLTEIAHSFVWDEDFKPERFIKKDEGLGEK